MPRDEVVAYLERYAKATGASVVENTPAQSVRQEDGAFIVKTGGETYVAPQLVLATGAFEKQKRPKGAGTFPARIWQMDLGEYTNPGALPDGGVPIIGSGQSGCQLTEEHQDDGRDMTFACGKAPWSPRVIDGRVIVWWAAEGGFYEVSTAEMPKEAREYANVLVTGHDGGRDMNLHTLAERGIRQAGHFREAIGETAYFENDLADSVAWGDAVYKQLSDYFTATAAKLGLEDPALGDPPPFEVDAPTEVDLSDVGTVLYATGFRPDYAAWLPWKDAFHEAGFPIQEEGSSTVVPGLHFIGTHFLRNRRSSLLGGVGSDAAISAARSVPG